ncbi:26700_t:CDS:2 [Dentiscutata erythropus]|uniref:26700_t:CDS:1 n=1 Tax=Dentiscutata erythropus TaxID=1348616 RepID=A0A9N8VI38_9GLOM|nr:26700_t:CDS:2 [Dentiscutata erythropus]
MKLCRFVIIITLVTIAVGMFFPAFSVFLRNKLERSSSLMTSLTRSNMDKNKRNVEIDDSTEFGIKLLKLLKKSVISVDPGDPSSEYSDYNKPKKISDYNMPANDTAQQEQLQEEEQTLQKIIVVLCSLGASLVLVTIAIGFLFWKVRGQAISNKKASMDNGSANINSQQQNDKDKDKDADDVRDEPDDRTNIDRTNFDSIINVNDNINDSLNEMEHDSKAGFPHVNDVNEEFPLDTKQSKMPRSAVLSYPNHTLSIATPSAPPAEEVELYDAGASNFSIPPPPPAYSSIINNNLINPSAPPLYDAPIVGVYPDSNSYFATIPFLPASNSELNIVSDAPMTPEETNSPLSSTALTFPINAINEEDEEDNNNNVSFSGPTHHRSTM